MWVEGICACGVPTYAQLPVCEHVCVFVHFGWGCTWHKMDPSGQAVSGQFPVDRKRKREREMMMRVGGAWPMGSSRDGAAC